MSRARAFVNDSFQGGAGRILTNQAPFTVEYLNSALEELQDKIGNYGSVTLIKDNYIATPLLLTPSSDPNVQTQLAFTGYFDGVTWHDTPTLPLDMLTPFRLWQRQTGSNLPFAPIYPPMQGMTGYWPISPWLSMWDWRTDAIFFNGTSVTADLRMRYLARLAAIPADSSEDNWKNTQIAIQASTNSLATLVAYAYARARGAAAAATMQADAKTQTDFIVNRYVRAAQEIEYGRQKYGGEEDGCYDSPNLPI
jgi:hypothetical protein